MRLRQPWIETSRRARAFIHRSAVHSSIAIELSDGPNNRYEWSGALETTLIVMKTLRGGTPEIPYRADIDGLRAIAVLFVIGFHSSPHLVPGGFVGVDIFFVISGFLISSLILDRLKNDSFSFPEFYGRRIRRLFPALTVVLLTVLVLGWFALPPAEYAALGRNTLAGAAFVANIQTYSEVGYFDAPAATKPLLHLWSLGVEEQFYFIFPALLLLCWRHRAMASSFALLGINIVWSEHCSCSQLSILYVLSSSDKILGIHCRGTVGARHFKWRRHRHSVDFRVDIGAARYLRCGRSGADYCWCQFCQRQIFSGLVGSVAGGR